MSTTLARRIRRIGLLPSTYTTTINHLLIKDEQGKMVTVEVPHPVKHINRIPLSLEELHSRRDEIVQIARKKRKANKK